MTFPTSLPKLPQTAADLLAGLLHSRIFAESIFGQVVEQSSALLGCPAGEYAATLVNKKVLMPWQAAELLAGRTRFYAGTFRLLEKLSNDGQTAIFVAEQPGAQRLVLLEVTPTDSVLTESAESYPSKKKSNHPHLANTVMIQLTPDFRLVAYDFIEAQPLRDVIVAQPPQRKHVADLVRQYAMTLGVLCNEAIGSLNPESALIDPQGQLKWLVAPSTLALGLEVGESGVNNRTAIQVAATRRFASRLGGLPEIASCVDLAEVIQRLSEFAEPWIDAFSAESLRCPRLVMNRLLRKGPSLRLIEAMGSDQQITDEDASETAVEFRMDAETVVPPPTPRLAPLAPSTAVVDTAGVPAIDGWVESPAPLIPPPEMPPIFPSVPALTELAQVIQKDRRGSVPSQKRRPRSWVFSLLLTGLIASVIAGVAATQWVAQWGAKRAAATSESQDHSEKLSSPTSAGAVLRE